MSAFDWIIPETRTVIFVLNWIIAVTLICGCGLIAVRALRNRSVPLRYGLLMSALFFAMLTPAAVLLLSHNGMSVIRWTITTNETGPEVQNRGTESKANGLATTTGNRWKKGVFSKDADSHLTGEATADISNRNRQAETGISRNGNRVTATRHDKRETGSSTVVASWWQIAGGFFIAVWSFGVLISAFGLARGWWAVCRLRRSFHAPGDERVERLANRAAKSLGLRHSPPVFESAIMPVPISLGLLQPAIVLPEDIGWDLKDDQLEAILLHETAHIKNRDHWVGLLSRVTAALLWWHPLVHQMNRRLADLREDICDNIVIREQGHRRGYAHVLVELASRTTSRPVLPTAIGLLENEFAGLEARVRRLLQDDFKPETRLSLAAYGVLASFTLLLAGMVSVTGVRAERAAPNNARPDKNEPTEKPRITTTVTVKTRDELIQAVRNAKPGTKILIAPGQYDGGLRFVNLHGEKGKPIILAAADVKNPPVISGGNSGLHLTDPSYVELHNLVITKSRANGLNIDDGGSYSSPAHHLVLKGLVVRDIGSNRNHDGIKLSGVDDFRIENCTVERWGKKGSGIDMVGCHNGIITGSTFREGDKIFGNAVQMKGGSSDITVSYCRFEDAGGRAINIGGSTGLPYFRPKPQGYEAKDITVAHCTFIGSMAPIAFVGVDGANVHHNTIYRPTRWVIRILQESRSEKFVACRNGRFTNNIVVFRSDELAYPVNIGPGTSPKSFKFAGNFWYCINHPEKTQRAVQLPTAEQNGVYGRDPRFRNESKGDLNLTTNSPAKNFGPQTKRPQ